MRDIAVDTIGRKGRRRKTMAILWEIEKEHNVTEREDRRKIRNEKE